MVRVVVVQALGEALGECGGSGLVFGSGTGPRESFSGLAGRHLISNPQHQQRTQLPDPVSSGADCSHR